MTTNDTANAKAPTHNAYQVREGSKQSYWTRIGAAWAHKDGNGFNIILECLPLDGKVTLRTVSEEQ